MKTAESDQTYTLSTDEKDKLGLQDCVVGDEYLLSVTKVNKDGSIEVAVETESTAEDATEPAESPKGKKKIKNPAMAAVMGE